MPEQTFPIAETFDSIQGEGQWTGTAMTFIRFAGCTVGKPYPPAARDAMGLQIYQEKCTSWDGTVFPCDTNYRMAEKMSIAQILKRVEDAEHVCLTGGEPLMHKLGDLLNSLAGARKKVHVETSGTIELGPELTEYEVWVAVSPKASYIRQCIAIADEVKVLVNTATDEHKLLDEFSLPYNRGRLWIQPINYENDLQEANLKFCMDMQQRYRKLRLSIQLHKVLGVR